MPSDRGGESGSAGGASGLTGVVGFVQGGGDHRQGLLVPVSLGRSTGIKNNR